MKWVLLILTITIPTLCSNIIQEKFRVINSNKKKFKPIFKKFNRYQTVIGTCKGGSSLGIYRNKIIQENELLYNCDISGATFEEIFTVPGLNNDSLLDFGFILNQGGIRQLYIIFSISDRIYHYEMVQELQDGRALAGPETPPPLNLKYLKFYVLEDINNDGTPEFINNIFSKNSSLTNWPDISDTLNLKQIYLESMKTN